MKCNLRIIFSLIFVCTVFLAKKTSAQYDPVVGVEVYIQAAGAYDTGSNLGFWDVPGISPKYRQGQNIQVYKKENRSDRKFCFYKDKKNPGYYYIVPSFGRSYGARVDVSGNKNNNGTNIQLWNANGGSAQSFKLKPTPSGNFKIYNRNGKVVCLASRSYANGSNIHIWDDHQGHWMEWVLINARTNEALANGLPQPKGRVIAPVGTNMDNIKITLQTNGIKEVVSPNSKGYYNFTNVNLSDKWMATIEATAPGLVSANLFLHKTRKANMTLTLKKPKPGNIVLKTKARGNYEYAKIGNHYVYVDGVVTSSRSNFFFKDINLRTPRVNKLLADIGVSGYVASTDKEIWEICQKTWEFFGKNKKSTMRTKDPMVKKANKEFCSSNPNGSVKYWPTIDQYAGSYEKYGFLPIGNCTSHALSFAALLHAAGVPANKMAVERFPVTHASEHWAVIIKFNDIWYWFDPQWATTPFPAFANLCNVGASTFDFAHPIEIVTLPGSNINYVPCCGKEGIVH
nr:RICIN domain-containing protein [uncultured Marinifilum sp.]